MSQTPKGEGHLITNLVPDMQCVPKKAAFESKRQVRTFEFKFFNSLRSPRMQDQLITSKGTQGNVFWGMLYYSKYMTELDSIQETGFS